MQKASAVVSPTQQGLTAEGWNAKGGALYRLNRYQEALQCFDNALEIDPQYTFAQKGKRTALLAQALKLAECS